MAIPTGFRIQATAETAPFTPEFLEKKERRALDDHAFPREYYGIPQGGQASPFTWELYERATAIRSPLTARKHEADPARPVAVLSIDNDEAIDRLREDAGEGRHLGPVVVGNTSPVGEFDGVGPHL
jgi:hypothetical protein